MVLAPFWQQSWFIGLILATLIGAIVALDRRRVVRHRRERARQAAFSQRLIETQEAERKRISTELHDSLGQDLFVIRAQVRSARAEGIADPRADLALEAIEGVARKASDDLKEATKALRPYHLDKIGLTSTIENMVAGVDEASGIRFTTDLEPIDHLLDVDRQIHLYRIVQESVTNVIKHSGAAGATVVVRRAGPVLQLRIEDDGRGFRAQTVDTPEAAGGGMGLMAIRERARSLGGDAEIRSAPGAGTTVVITIPIERNPHGQ